jgi:hypothetical protein
MKLKTKKIEKWLEVERGSAKAEFLCTILTPKEASALLQETQRVTWDRNQRFTDPDYYKFKKKLIEKTIIDWKGIEDENGAVLPCTTENKELVYAFNPDIIDEVINKIQAETEKIGEDEEIERKNL